MGKQVANNRAEHHQMIYNEGKVEFKPYGLSLIKKEYIPLGNTLIYPATWTKQQAIEAFVNYKMEDLEKGINEMNKKLDELIQTKIEWLK